MPNYLRSVLFRVAGALAGMSLWVGLIVLALANLDERGPLPDSVSATWPFWLVTLAIAAGAFFVRRRLGPGPGWGAFAIGVFAPFVGLFINANLGDGGGLWFWLPVLVLIFVPLTSPGTREATGGS